MPNISGPFRSRKYPWVKPWREKAASSWAISSAVGSRFSRRARAYTPVTMATYSGRFIRPSIFKQATPICSSSPRWLARDISFRDRGYSSARLPQPYFIRQGWAHRPRLPLRPPMREDR